LNISQSDWTSLIQQIRNNRCIPFIGAGACQPWLPLGSKIAYDWSEEYGYPLDDKWQLDKVAQFVGIVNDEDEMFPKVKICDSFANVKSPDFAKYKDALHAVLARMKFPLYITTNYDKFMEEALMSSGRVPDSEYCRWNEALELSAGTSLFSNPEYTPTLSRPLVYHLHGTFDDPQSIVLTEKDYIYFLINLSKDEKLLPTYIRKALVTKSLLFIGYSLVDINFRVIFQGIMSVLGRNFQLPSISVQLPPDCDEDKKEKVISYLRQYSKNMFKVRIHWIEAQGFVNELYDRLDKT
jgi:hypothetical protein